MKLKLIAAAFAASFAISLPAMTAQAEEGTSRASYSAYAAPNGDNTFTSDYFGMTLEIPASWTMASEAEAEKVLNIGTDMVSGDDETLKKQMDASVRQSLPLFFASRHPLSEVHSDNINLSSIAENVSAFPSVKRGSQYFDNMKLIATRSATPMNFADGYDTRMIGGVSFDSMDAEIPLGAVTVKQVYYAARIGDHIVSMIATYQTDEDKLILDSLVDKIEFDDSGT